MRGACADVLTADLMAATRCARLAGLAIPAGSMAATRCARLAGLAVPAGSMAATRCSRLTGLAIAARFDGGDPLLPANRACDRR
ncbi:MAG: hypothetical protein CK428_04290 [Mycobacterium sp.]|nr:MAG: hypothetical protein CK428_04290 [Mycobacterium sp.]